MRYLEKLFYFTYKFILVLTVVIVFSSITLQIFARYFLNRPLIWTEELSLFAFCWFTFIGSTINSYENSHIKIDFFFNRLPAKMKHVINFLIQLSTLALSLAMIYLAFTAMGVQTGIRTPALRMPYYYFTAAIAVGFIGICAVTLKHLLTEYHLRNNPNKRV